jgi:hypothetical protein
MSTLPRVLILDFDGTMTDADAEGEPFIAGYLDDLEALVGADTPEKKARVRALADDVLRELHDTPELHPFRWKGKAVAPASVDPYLRMVPVAIASDRHDAFANRRHVPHQRRALPNTPHPGPAGVRLAPPPPSRRWPGPRPTW